MHVCFRRSCQVWKLNWGDRLQISGEARGRRRRRKEGFFGFPHNNTPAFHSKFVQVKPPFLANNGKRTQASFAEETVPTGKKNITGFWFGKRAYSIYFFYINYCYKMSPWTGVIAPAAVVVVVRLPSCDYPLLSPFKAQTGASMNGGTTAAAANTTNNGGGPSTLNGSLQRHVITWTYYIVRIITCVCYNT